MTKVKIKNFVLVPYPLSISQRERLVAKIGTHSFSILSLFELKNGSPIKGLLELLSVKAENIYIYYDDPSIAVLEDALVGLSIFLRGDRVQLVSPEGKLSPISKFSAIKGLIRFCKNSLRLFLSLLTSALHLLWLKSVSRREFDIQPGSIFYLKTNLWIGVKAGGSVGHVAGVINGFLNRGFKLIFSGFERPLLVKKDYKFLQMMPPKIFGYPPELNNFYLHRQLNKFFPKALKEPISFIYQRLSIGNFTGVVLSRIFKVPLVLEYNGSEVWVSKNWSHNPFFAIPWFEAAENICLKHAHYIVTVSEVLRDELIARGVEPERILTYPNCVDPEIYSPTHFSEEQKKLIRQKWSIPEGAKVVTFLGTFGRWHGVSRLALAIAKLVEEDLEWLEQNKVLFLLIGDGLEMKTVQSILELVPERYVKMTGLVEQHLGPELLAISDIQVTPQVPNEDGSRFFGSPTKLFEYMAMEKPIIASDLEQIGQILEGSLHISEANNQSDWSKSCAALVRPGSVDDLKAAIYMLVSHPEVGEQIAKNARERVLNRYTWKHHVGAIIDGFNSFAARKTSKGHFSLIVNSISKLSVIWRKFAGYSFTRKVIDRLSTKFLVPILKNHTYMIESCRGTKFRIQYPEDVGWECLLVFKDYESGTSDLCENLIRDGDIVYDVGANIGWYSMLFSRLVGSKGKVYAYEPMPKIFEKLKMNRQINFGDRSIQLNNAALSDEPKDLELFTYEGLPHGLTSGRALYGDRNVHKVTVPSKTLSEEWKRNDRHNIRMIKVDVEGFELSVVKGAEELLKSAPPLWLIEINFQTSKAFHWHPQELVDYLSKGFGYKFIRVREAWGKNQTINDFNELKNGDVVLCYIPEQHQLESISH